MSSPTAEQLVAELTPLALAQADFVQLPPPPPPPKPAPAKPVAPKPAAPAAGTTAGAAATPAPVATAPAAPAVAPKPPAPPAPPPPPVQVCDHALKGVDLDVAVRTDAVVAAAEVMRRHDFAIDTITGVDWLAKGLMEVVYDYFHPETGMHVAIRCRVSREQPDVPTITAIFQGANWHERETHDFFGIRFVGHPDLTPFLLPEDATYHPLRKDFAGAPAE
jgi:NADH-quinone oxidoreductase subunit C